MTVADRPRLLLVVHLPPPIHGVTVMNKRIVESALLASRFNVDVLPLQFADAIEDIGRPSLKKFVHAGRIAGQLAWRLVTQKPDAVYLSISPRGAAFYRDCLYVGITKLLRARCVLHVHAKHIVTSTDCGLKQLFHKNAFRGTHVIALSPSLAVGRDANVRVASVRYVANGIPDSGSAATRARSATTRILYLSNMLREKGPLDLLDALSVLKQRGVAFVATFAGAASSDSCLRDFGERVEGYGLAREVRYVGPMYGAEKDALLATHDVFVLPTYDDAFPLVLLEAMQHALPIVSTAEGAIPDIVDHGHTGLLGAPRDVAVLAKHLATLIDDPDLRASMGALGRKRYLEHFTQEAFESNLAFALEQCLDQAAVPE